MVKKGFDYHICNEEEEKIFYDIFLWVVTVTQLQMIASVCFTKQKNKLPEQLCYPDFVTASSSQIPHTLTRTHRHCHCPDKTYLN